MRLAILVVVALQGLGGCLLDPATERYDPRYPTRTSELERINPYHRDKTPDTPYEVRKGEMERDDHLAGRTGPTYPPLFEKQKKDDAEDGGT